MRSRLRLCLALMLPLAFAAVVVTHREVHRNAVFVHHRSEVWEAVSLICVAAVLLLAWFPSRLLAVAAGVLAGGMLGNVSWALRHGGWVSNSWVLGFRSGGVAFNLADTFELAGIALLIGASIRLTVEHRARLPRTTVAVRLARRVIALRRG